MEERFLSKPRDMPATKKKKLTRSQLIKSLDKVFSIFIRQRDKGVCFTCGTKQEWKYMQNGHFVSRSHYATRWDEKNCHCQCLRCNCFMSGNYPVYAERMIDKYGHEIVRELNRLGQKLGTMDNAELERKIEHYKSKITV